MHYDRQKTESKKFMDRFRSAVPYHTVNHMADRGRHDRRHRRCSLYQSTFTLNYGNALYKRMGLVLVDNNRSHCRADVRLCAAGPAHSTFRRDHRPARRYNRRLEFSPDDWRQHPADIRYRRTCRPLCQRRSALDLQHHSHPSRPSQIGRSQIFEYCFESARFTRVGIDVEKIALTVYKPVRRKTGNFQKQLDFRLL